MIKRQFEGIIPPHLAMEIYKRNKLSDPTLAASALKMLVRTNQLFTGSAARKSQLFRFMEAAGKAERFIYDALNKEEQPGTLLRTEGQPAPTGDATRLVDINNAYDFLGIIRDYYMQVHGRNSIDANGMALRAICHYGQDFLNAYWDGQYMTMGDGDLKIFLTFVLLNVIAHEMTHGVTEYAIPGGLTYYGQAGAGNEWLSDFLGGAAVESWFLKLSAKQYHWLVGKGIWAPSSDPKAIRRGLRDMVNPGTAYNDPQLGKDPQPADMAHYVKTRSDNGGVHTNSGILNRFAALWCLDQEGDTWADTTGKVVKIIYAARPDFGNNPSFAQMAYHCVEACAVIPGEEAAQRAKALKALKTVGITPSKTELDTLTPAADSGDDSDSE
jgi:Zn-dependent metalloprotease